MPHLSIFRVRSPHVTYKPTVPLPRPLLLGPGPHYLNAINIAIPKYVYNMLYIIQCIYQYILYTTYTFDIYTYHIYRHIVYIDMVHIHNTHTHSLYIYTY